MKYPWIDEYLKGKRGVTKDLQAEWNWERYLLDEAYRLVLSSFSGKKQREILGLSVCGTDCTKCGCYGDMCTGCNEACGKVFHAPKGQPCPIYRCAVNQNKYANCAGCDRLPCDIWRNTKDPSMTDEAFEASIAERVGNLK